ncbi:precorrin-4 C(11)-methyltransferase [Desulfovibrio mangrovi]|uniref:precorrin-4 C(11)-methyltransferase n=1 Tax=Desulfovibrio mangrovi TaxID=2976983 RepID=UPI0022483C25|nr:precorrin-4 C(11)-methyltransferase [Desulfovibrio mangrovi]UZP68952.1 precorrin-4 C(11)-methyltransferase [Desulfovibrio mangrovi]
MRDHNGVAGNGEEGEGKEGFDVSVWFIGAGPGDPELITVKGQRLIAEADLVLYAGSLVPEAVIANARTGAEVVDSASMNLEETHACIMRTVASGGMVARVHTGDPSLYGAIREQMHLLEAESVRYAVVPGVTAGFAAAAATATSLTVPDLSQSFIITRLEGRTPVPETEKLRDMARHRCAMAIYLSTANPQGIVDELRAGGLEDNVPVIAAYRVGWPDQLVVHTTVGGLCDAVREYGLTRQTVFLVLPGEDGSERYSKLYDPVFPHGYRRSKQSD